MHEARLISRRTKAATLLPGALASCLATVTILATTSATATPPVVAKRLPGGGSVPVQSIQTQATITPKGEIAAAVARNSIDAVVTGSTTSGIPAVALNAYQRAAQVINASAPSCNMRWELIGAIGRVESDNGQFGGNHLNASGTAVPGVYGPALDGTNGIGLIRDTDGGVLDHNTTYDRAVGPMQFLPSTWAVVGVDGNGDGRRDPQNIYDASLATAVYLCSGQRNMSDNANLRSAVFSYNHSADYVNLVIAIMKAYQAGNFSSIPAGVYGSAAAPANSALPRTHHADVARRTRRSATAVAPASEPSPSQAASPTPSRSSNPLQNLVNGLTGNKSASPPASGAPMSSTQAASYCQAHLSGYIDLLGTLHASCTRKLTGLTTSQADAGWAAHRTDLAAWFRS